MTNDDMIRLMDETVRSRNELKLVLAYHERKIKILRAWFRNEGMENMRLMGLKHQRQKSKREAYRENHSQPVGV